MGVEENYQYCIATITTITMTTMDATTLVRAHGDCTCLLEPCPVLMNRCHGMGACNWPFVSCVFSGSGIWSRAVLALLVGCRLNLYA